MGICKFTHLDVKDCPSHLHMIVLLHQGSISNTYVLRLLNYMTNLCLYFYFIPVWKTASYKQITRKDLPDIQTPSNKRVISPVFLVIDFLSDAFILSFIVLLSITVYITIIALMIVK